MGENVIHVFGVDKNTTIPTITKFFEKIFSNKTPSSVDRNDKIMSLRFNNLDENDFQQLNLNGYKVKIGKNTFPIIINDEILHQTNIELPNEIYQSIISDYIDKNPAEWVNLMNGLKVTRNAEDGPWILTGSFANLGKFEEKCKNIFHSKFKLSAPSSSSPSSPSLDHSQPSVRPKEKFLNGVDNKSENDSKEDDFRTKNDAKGDEFTSIMSKNGIDENNLELLIGNDLKIIINVGKIDEQKVGAIVNPVFEYKPVDPPTGAKSICAQSVQQNAKDAYKVGSTEYYVAQGDLPCKHVIDIVLPSNSPKDDSEANQFFVPMMQTCYLNCLNMCKYLESRSIAFQPLGHELSENAATFTSAAAAHTVFQLIQQDSLGSIREIRFVSPDETVVRRFVKSFYEFKNILGSSVDVKILSPSSLAAGDASQKASIDGGKGPESNSLDKSRSAKLSPQKAASALDEEDDSEDSVEEMDYADFCLDDDAYLSPSSNGIPPQASAASASVVVPSPRDDCSICLCELTKDDNVKILPKCFHKFHSACIDTWMEKKSTCPMCQTRYGPPRGNQPPGCISIREIPYKVPGYKDAKSCIEITYSIPGGIQGPDHPHPGTPFSGTTRICYVPNNPKGQEIAKLLKMAFDFGLIFTVGTSITTGRQNTVVWNNIHHKTSIAGGPFGYPDHQYLDRVEDELKAAGVDKTMLK